MSCQEIQELLQNQPDDDMSDWINMIQQLKKEIVILQRWTRVAFNEDYVLSKLLLPHAN